MLCGNLLIIPSYPIFLRWSLRAIQWMLPDTDYGRYYRETVQFLLDHPRRCYTTLFQSKETWWLFASVVGMNALDWILFEILNVRTLSSNLSRSTNFKSTIILSWILFH